jgi:hypothetical protein
VPVVIGAPALELRFSILPAVEKASPFMSVTTSLAQIVAVAAVTSHNHKTAWTVSSASSTPEAVTVAPLEVLAPSRAGLFQPESTQLKNCPFPAIP